MESTSSWDVIIIGAGPAGSSTAIGILEESPGTRVLLIDARKVIGHPYRDTAAISIHHLKEAGRLDLPDDVKNHPINGAVLVAPDGRRAVADVGRTMGYVMDRTKLDQYLAGQAKRLGAEVRTHTNGVVDVGDVITTNLTTGERGLYDPATIVMACGPSYDAVRKAGFPEVVPRGDDLHAGAQHTVQCDTLDTKLIQMHFGQKIAPRGYAWSFPESSTHHRVGIGIPTAGNPGSVKELLMKFKARLGVADCPVTNRTGGIIPTCRPFKKVVRNVHRKTVAVVGDAAYMCDASTGGGDHTAMICGRQLGRYIGNGNDSDFNHWYARKWYRTLRQRYVIKRVAYSLSDVQINDGVAMLARNDLSSVEAMRRIPEMMLSWAFRNPSIVARAIGAYLRYGW